MAEFEKMDLASADLVAERIEQLKQLLPEVVSESGIDFEKLRLVLGDEVDEGTERYAFTWPGKTDAIRQSQTPSAATLRPAPKESVNWDETENLYIEGDNLEVLKLLQHSYHGRVKMIFIDPPYNTGHDFVYKDRFGDTIENYREQAGLTGQSNSETSGRFHSDWCSMMYPRLRLARELLADDGLIFITIDDGEQGTLHNLCNEVFGEANFIGNLIWEKKYTRANDAVFFSSNHDFILCYAKNISLASIGKLPRTDEMNKAYTNPDNDPRGPWKATPIHARSGSADGIFEYVFSNGVHWTPPTGTYPRYSRETLAELDATGQIWFGAKGDAVPSRKTYLSKVAEGGIVPTTIIPHDLGGHNHMAVEEVKELFGGKNVFTSPKPVKLLKLLMRLGKVQSGDIVLDFFSGSATTGEAVMRTSIDEGINASFILVQLPEACDAKSEASKAGYSTICELGEQRLRSAGTKIAAEIEEANKQLRLGEEPVPDIGFRVLKLDESGIERPKPGELLLDVVKPDRSDEDIIFEMMLKWGLELTLPIEKVNAAGYPCYSVAYGELVCCLADGLNMQVLDAIADMEPRRVLMLDRILDDTTKLNAVQAFKRVEEKTGREVELRTV